MELFTTQEIRNIVKVQRLQHILFDHTGNHIIGRNDHIIACALVLQDAVHGLVALEGIVHDLDTGLGGEVIQHRLVNVDAPVVDVDHALISGAGIFGVAGVAAAAAGQQTQGESSCAQECERLFQFLSLSPFGNLIYNRPLQASYHTQHGQSYCPGFSLAFRRAEAVSCRA